MTPTHRLQNTNLIIKNTPWLYIANCRLSEPVYCHKIPPSSHIILFNKPPMKWPPVVIHTPIIPSWRSMRRVSRFIGEGSWGMYRGRRGIGRLWVVDWDLLLNRIARGLSRCNGGRVRVLAFRACPWLCVVHLWTPGSWWRVTHCTFVWRVHLCMG